MSELTPADFSKAVSAARRGRQW